MRRPRRRFQHKVEWTNWTFGPWWGRIGYTHHIAFDLGPLQMRWSRPSGRRRR